MIPLYDHNPTRGFPIVTVVLIVLNVGFFLLVGRSSVGGEIDGNFAYEYAAVPCEIVTGRPLTASELIAGAQGETEACDAFSSDSASPYPGKPVYLTVLFSMFLHADFLHLAGNLLFLWVFGNNIEDRMGHVPYLLFYLLSGVVATMAHVLVGPDSTVPIVGASGAIAGVMGAYLVLFPRVPIRSLVFFFLVDIPAGLLLAFWLVLQFFTSPSDGIAWVAHVAGFVFGALAAFIFRERLRDRSVPRTTS